MSKLIITICVFITSSVYAQGPGGFFVGESELDGSECVVSVAKDKSRKSSRKTLVAIAVSFTDSVHEETSFGAKIDFDEFAVKVKAGKINILSTEGKYSEEINIELDGNRNLVKATVIVKEKSFFKDIEEQDSCVRLIRTR